MKTLLARALCATTLAFGSAAALAATPALVYKSPTCGCCEEYVTYLRDQGFAVNAVNRDDMSAVKQRFGTEVAPSCHTVVIGQYVVEGHVPVGAIEKLLKEQPDIRGLSVPGMPAHSPGMGPHTPGTLPVVAIAKDSSVADYGKF